MGLDVGVVRIEYLDRPRSAAYGFVWHLAREWDDDCWQVSSGPNVFIEMGYDHMVERAARFISSEGLGATQAHHVMRWVRMLPWSGDVVMLHLGW